MPRETSGLALPIPSAERGRLTLRFHDPAVEQAFQLEAGTRLHPQTVGTLVLGALAWAATAAFLIVAFPVDVRSVVLSIGAVEAAILGLGYPLLRARMWDSVQAIGALINLIGGIAIVVIGGFIVDLPYLVTPALLVNTIFAFGPNRFGPVGAIVTAPYVLVFAILVVFGWLPEIGLFEVFLVGLGFGVAAVGGYLLEASTRGIFWQRRIIASQQEALAEEKAKAERLVSNMLPDHVAARLRDRPMSLADRLPAVSVLFADLVGFTPLAGRLTPDALVAVLDELFGRFDELAAKHRLEKIKTIGDAYMAVAGATSGGDPSDDHAARAVAMGLDMLGVVERYRDEISLPLQLRVGVHTGPVVAGVIGRVRFSYDLWGDTVNVASRMESHGVAGAVQVSEVTARELGNRFPLVPMGVIDVRGKGPMTTFLARPQGAPTADSDGSHLAARSLAEPMSAGVRAV
jgi:class 3 adenylate cyclase